MRQLEPLPADTRQLLLLAAAEPVGDVTLLRRAAELLGIARRRGGAGRGRGADRDRRPRALPPSAGALGGLPRGAACRTGATSTARWPRRPTRSSIPTAGRGTARTPRPVPTRRWPASWSAPPAARRHRGGVAAAAAFLERAAELTPDPARRGARALAAAQAKFESPARPTRRSSSLAIARARPARRAPARAARPAARARSRSRCSARQRRAAAAARRGQAARAARSRRWRGRRTSRRSARRCTPGASTPTPACATAAEAARAAPAAPRPPRSIDLRPRRPGDAVHGRARRGRAAAAARAQAFRDEPLDGHERRHALAAAVARSSSR